MVLMRELFAKIHLEKTADVKIPKNFPASFLSFLLYLLPDPHFASVIDRCTLYTLGCIGFFYTKGSESSPYVQKLL